MGRTRGQLKVFYASYSVSATDRINRGSPKAPPFLRRLFIAHPAIPWRVAPQQSPPPFHRTSGTFIDIAKLA
jgi:hypothetical protein